MTFENPATVVERETLHLWPCAPAAQSKRLRCSSHSTLICLSKNCCLPLIRHCGIRLVSGPSGCVQLYLIFRNTAMYQKPAVQMNVPQTSCANEKLLNYKHNSVICQEPHNSTAENSLDPKHLRKIWTSSALESIWLLWTFPPFTTEIDNEEITIMKCN